MTRSSTLSRSIGSGEHGVGVGKKEYLIPELGEGTVNLMKTVKDAIDPNQILNPGKVCLNSPASSNEAHLYYVVISRRRRSKAFTQNITI